MPHSSPPPSSASSTDLEKIQGPITLAQLIKEIELVTGTHVVTLGTGRKNLLIYRSNSQPPIVDLNVMVDVAVIQREARSVEVSEAKTAANLAFGRHRVSPKKAERVGATIYFNAACEDNETYTISWSQ